MPTSFKEGEEVEGAVLDASFWRIMDFLFKLIEPLMKVLRNVDSEELP